MEEIRIHIPREVRIDDKAWINLRELVSLVELHPQTKDLVITADFEPGDAESLA